MIKHAQWAALAAALLTGCATTSSIKIDPCADLESRMETLVARHVQLDRVFNTPAFDDEARWLAADYEKLLYDCPDHDQIAALATRSIGNINLALEQLDQALAWYDRVASSYPEQTWEVLQALKSAADALHDLNQTERARGYDQKILELFTDREYPDGVSAVLKAVQARWTQDDQP